MLMQLLRALAGRVSLRQPAPARGDTRTTTHAGARAISIAASVARARAALARGDLTAARRELREVAGTDPRSIEIGLMLATIEAQSGDLQAAEQRLRALAPEQPDDVAALHDTLGNVMRLQGRPEPAIAQYDMAIAAMPGLAGAHANRALCLQDLGRFEEARRGFGLALEIDPTNLATSASMAALEFDVGDDDAASARIDGVLAAAPGFAQAHWVRAFALLRRGDYNRAWDDYELRDRDAGRAAPSPDLPVWQGERLPEGTLLVCAEQGLGDQIMFASCLPDLAREVGTLVVECDPRLVGIFGRSYPGMRIYPHAKKSTQPWLRDGVRPSVKTWLGSLPGHYRRSRAAFERQRYPYLEADPALTDAFKRRLAELGPGLKIGISWRGGTPVTRSAMRSIPLERWLPVLARPDVRFIALQYGDHADEVDSIQRLHGVSLVRWPEALQGDYDSTAALVSALDLTISVQTAVVHLAGAMGKKVWVLVPRVAEWRYGAVADRMDWYPSARIFRQYGETWSSLIEDVAAGIDRLRT